MEEAFLKKMVMQLKNTIQFKKRIYEVDHNEKLKAGTDGDGNELGLYSLHLTSNQFNVRFICAFHEKGYPMFLVAFYEKGKKRATDYTKQIPVAIRRKKELSEEREGD